MGREASPALSEHEVDISRHLYGGDDHSDSGEDFLAEANSTTGRTRASHNNPAIASFLEDDGDEDDDAFIAATQAAANRKNESKASKRAGAFQSMGLNPNLLKAITRKGFSVPTPIQRKTIPLVLDGQDVVGMARTGSGKTAAFVIPMIEKLKTHSAKVGARSIVLSPSRELALQTMKVIKEMSRGTDLRTILLVGGDSLEEQFSSMASNPDIIVATPGRFEHLKVEMSLELSSVKYVVFDEADRLFEMGFAAQLAEIMHSLPPDRQTLLFSATLPKSLVEFARAGLHDPKLVRLDAETKIAPGLHSAFFSIKKAEKEGALLQILEDVIKMPVGAASTVAAEISTAPQKKRKRGQDTPSNEQPSPHSTVIFVATKHHVDYLASLLKAFGYAVSYVYGALDQTARKMQVQDFRSGITNILVVTDVAARGLDIPVLANVINYDFPSQPKIYVHRVGRTARAGREGWSYSLITQQDMPYLVDLQLFLGRKLIVGRAEREAEMFKNAITLGTLRPNGLENGIEEAAKMLDKDSDLEAMRIVAEKGEKQYLRTRNSASAESVKRAKQLALSQELKGVNLLFDDEGVDLEAARLDMLARLSGFRPVETVFEVGKRGKTDEAAEFMRQRRAKIKPKYQRKAEAEDAAADAVDASEDENMETTIADPDSEDELVLTRPGADMADASDDDLEMTFSQPASRKKSRWQDSEHFMSYTPAGANAAEDRGYGVHSGSNSNFVAEAKGVSMDLNNDETKAFGEASRAKGMRWDKKHKKYVARANDEDGSKGQKYIIGESGQKIAASFRSGRFDAWRKANKVDRLPRVGEQERGNAHYVSHAASKRYKHKQELAPKDADKFRDDYFVRKKRVEEAKEARRGRFAEGKGKNELKGAEDVRKMRKLAERRKEKNARPSKRK